MKYYYGIEAPGLSQTGVMDASSESEAVGIVRNTVDSVLSIPQPPEERKRELSSMVWIRDSEFRRISHGAITEFASELVMNAVRGEVA